MTVSLKIISVALAGRFTVIATLALALAVPTQAEAPWHLEAPGFDGDMRPFTLRQTPSETFVYPLLTPDGQVEIPGSFEGKVVLLNFWATWCPPCVEEMPSLDRLQAALGGERFEVVALSLDQGGLPVVEAFYQDHGLEHLGIYLDEEAGRAFQHYRVGVLPTSILLLADGRTVGTLGGPAHWDSPEAKALIRFFIDRDGEGS
ncbi:MAG: TlpA family protein disulfide reductase [Pseudomonadota bacterium]